MASRAPKDTRGGTTRESGRCATRATTARSLAGRTRERAQATACALEQLEAARGNATIEIDGARVSLANLDKVLWPADPRARLPAYTRRDHLRYLLRVAPYLLPHVAARPLTLIRTPEGVAGRRFVQFHWEQRLPPYVERIDIYSEKQGRAESYLLCNNVPTLLWLAHVGVLELNVWHSRAQAGRDARGAGADYASSLASLQRSVLNRPDYLVFDLDPYIYAGHERRGEPPAWSAAAFDKTKSIAFALKALLDAMNLGSRVKSSGKTGLHVLVPIVRSVTYDVARALARSIATHLARAHPRDITTTWATAARSGRVFLDYNMNARVKTLAAPYSPRVQSGAPVSMPLSWSALAHAEPLDYTMETALERLERDGDLWSDILEAKEDLMRALALP